MKAKAHLPDPPPWSWFLAVVAKLIPRKFRVEYMDSLGEMSDRPTLEQIVHARNVLIRSYKTLAVQAVNLYEFVAELALVTFIFGTAGYSGISLWLVVPTASSLLALALRDVYGYQFKTGKITGSMTLMQKYWLDSSIDAICAMLFSIVAQGFVLYLEPSMAVPDPVLFRAVAGMPAADGGSPHAIPSHARSGAFRESDISGVTMFRLASRVAGFWFVMFTVTVMLGTSDIHNYGPDKLRGWFAWTPFLWVALHRDALARRNPIRNRLKSRLEQQLQRVVDVTPEPLQKSDPMYYTWRSSEFIIFIGLAFCVEAVVRPWLEGWEGRNATALMVMANVMGFTMCLCTWKYVKALTYAAGQLAREQLKEIKRQDKIAV